MELFHFKENIANKKNESFRNSAFVFWLLAMAGLILIEQTVKQVASKEFTVAYKWAGVGVENFKNYHFAFSLPVPYALIFVIYFILLSCISIYLYRRFHLLDSFSKVGWLLIMAGAVSNVGERLVLGYVRDYIYIFSGIFNLADFYIFAGVIILFYQDIKLKK